MYESDRSIVVRIGMNKAEYNTLQQMAAARGIGLAATLREYIHQNNNPSMPPKGTVDQRCKPSR